MRCRHTLYRALVLLPCTIAQSSDDGDKASRFLFPPRGGSAITINYDDVLVVSWTSSYDNPYLRFWGYTDPSTNNWDIFLNTSVSPTGSYVWSFADNVSSIVSWPLGGHFDLSTNKAGVSNLQAGGLEITSTSGSPQTFSTASTSSSTTSSSVTSTLPSSSSSTSTSSNNSQTLASSSSGSPAATSPPSSSDTRLGGATGLVSPVTVTSVQTVIASATPSPAASPSGLSSGTKAGIGVGVSIGALLAVATGAVFFRRYRRIRSGAYPGETPYWRRRRPFKKGVALTEMSGEDSIKEMSTEGQLRELPAEDITAKPAAQYR